jgi:adenylylsulfate kinase-like enzyme
MISFEERAALHGPRDGRMPQQTRHLWIVTGPAGCGKSTIAEYLSETLHLPYIEGDEVSLTMFFGVLETLQIF